MSEVRLLACALLLAAGVAAAVSAATVRFSADAAPGIASVRLAELVAEQAARTARADGPAKETAAASRAWAQALEEALALVAARHRAVLLPARAVAAGAPDLTAEIEAALADALASSAVPAPESQP